MLTKTLLLTTALTAALYSAGTAAKDRIVVLAEDYPLETAETIASSLAGLFDALRSGDRLLGIRAGSGATLFEAAVPDDPLFDRHLAHRTKHLRPAWEAAMRHLKDSTETPPRGPAPSQVDFPGMLEALGYFAATKPEVTFFGEPRFVDERTPEFGMMKGYPTDGHFGLSRSDTPFGTAGLEGTLEGIQIHFCATSDDWANEAHREGVQRTYALLADGYGAQLATFSADIAGCSARFREGRSDGARMFQRNPADQRFGMVDVTLPPPPPQPDPPPTPSAAAPAAELPLELRLAIATGTVEMQNLFLFDTDKEDGDVVEIVATGFQQQVRLTKAGLALEVPVTQGALIVIGRADGGGGITVGIRTDDGRTIASQKIRVGERLAIPVTAL